MGHFRRGAELMSGILSALAGASGGRVLTVGNSGVTSYGYQSGNFGSLSPTEFLSSNIVQLYWGSTGFLYLKVTGWTSDTGWETMNIGGTVFLRSNASFGEVPNTWIWSGIASNPFGTSGIVAVNIA
jgi:hypothetical protein